MQENNDLFKRKLDNDESKTRIYNKNIDEIINDPENREFEDVYSNNNVELKNEVAKNKKKKMPGFVKIVIMFGIALALATVIIIALVDFIGLTFNNDKTAEINIKSGFSTAQIAEELQDKGVIKFPLLFRVYSRLSHADGYYQFGMYEIKDSQGYSSIIRTLKQPGQSGEVVNITIPEGYSVQEIAKLMQENGVCSEKEFINAVKNTEYEYDFIKDIPTHSVYYRLEGYLYPDTYQLFKNTDGNSGQACAERAVKKMLEQMNNVIDDELINSAQKRGYSVHEVLTLASIVELEASGYTNDMAKVAQVFYNRLRWTDQPAMLGSTPTSDYPDSRYDTNKNEGLPPGPLCSPSIDAIKAALNPDTSVKADYFVTDKNMKFYYTDSYDEHNELIESLKSEGLWN